jgi:cytochrome d ubiquinol oxidase subunit II
METVWYLLVGFVVSTYVVLDGFDLGAGVLHLFVARTGAERRQVLRAIGPVWDGNEVWLIAAGGTLLLAFPNVLATTLSGFYLPFMIVLWLLVFRALGIELRAQNADPLWTAFWDAAFFLASTLLVVFFGAALGNVVRGVTFDGDHDFFAPLWTTFGVDGEVGILDWFTVLVALQALFALTLHGALWLAWRTDEAVQTRSARIARMVAPFCLVLAILTSVLAFAVQPRLAVSLAARPWGVVFPFVALAALVSLLVLGSSTRHAFKFLCSAAHLYGLLGAAAVGLFPALLPGRTLDQGLTTLNSSSGTHSLAIGLAWWIPGILLVLGCHYFVYSRLPKKVSVKDGAAH